MMRALAAIAALALAVTTAAAQAPAPAAPPAKGDAVWEGNFVWGDGPPPSSDHRLVWLDVTAGKVRCPPGSDPTASASSHPRR